MGCLVSSFGPPPPPTFLYNISLSVGFGAAVGCIEWSTKGMMECSGLLSGGIWGVMEGYAGEYVTLLPCVHIAEHCVRGC